MIATIIACLIESGCSRPSSRASDSKGPIVRMPAVRPPPEEPKLYAPPPKLEKPFILQMGPGVSMEFGWIPPGEFTMGDPNEKIPRHLEKIERPFYLGKTEVTQEQWNVVMATDPSVMKGPKLPVHRAQWEDCQVFLKAMNERYARTGMKFALPTEVQWEYACRAGNVVRVDTPDDPVRIGDYAWLGSNSQYEPHTVAQKKPNDWGLYDMQGNVAEWCSDVLPPTAGISVSPPAGAKGGTSDEPWYAVRGGNYRDGPSACLSTSRLVRRSVVPMRHDGLRLMCTPR